MVIFSACGHCICLSFVLFDVPQCTTLNETGTTGRIGACVCWEVSCQSCTATGEQTAPLPPAYQCYCHCLRGFWLHCHTAFIPTLSVYHTVCDASVRLLINCINSAEQKTLWPQVAIKIKANRCMLCVVLLLWRRHWSVYPLSQNHTYVFQASVVVIILKGVTCCIAKLNCGLFAESWEKIKQPQIAFFFNVPAQLCCVMQIIEDRLRSLMSWVVVLILFFPFFPNQCTAGDP